jgi:hypothetical protein
VKVLISLIAAATLAATPSAVALRAQGPVAHAPHAAAVAHAPHAAAVGHVSIVQAVPGADVDVVIDGEAVASDVEPGKVLGPYKLSAGEHEVDFSGPDGLSQATTLDVAAGSNQDVVLHLPASVGGAAVVTSYQTPTDPIAPGKARVLVAHTATVAPADVRVDGQVVFTNIANGEFATADVPAGKHVAALLPTGESGPVILGPLTVDLTAQTITMVYALGNPADDSMSLVAHVARLASDGSLVPATIATGSAGLAADVRVHPFGRTPS